MPYSFCCLWSMNILAVKGWTALGGSGCPTRQPCPAGAVHQDVRVCTLQVLVAAASNIAVDNLVDRLTTADPKLIVVRVGHPARLLPQVRRKTLYLASMVPGMATIFLPE